MDRLRALTVLLLTSAGLGAQEPPAPAGKKGAARLGVAQRNVYLSAQRAMEWLHRANRPDGRFVHGFIPALRQPMEGENLIDQAGAAFALARAAAFFGDERGLAVAKQAVLTALLETAVDPRDKNLRYSAAPPHLLNRPAATAFLVLAICELPAPGADLVEASEQMVNYLRTLLAADGLVRVDEPGDAKAGPHAGEADFALQHHSGPVLYAIARSHALRPAAWKLEALRKACPVYHNYWQRTKNLPMVAWHSAACAEGFAHTKEAAFADAVFAMNDWLCEQQYGKLDARRAHWTGGFMTWSQGKMTALPPDARAGAAAFALAQAGRVARASGDAARLGRYQKSLEAGLVFLGTLQYTDAATQHFADWFRPAIVGGFHASHQDGNLRIDYARDCLLAQVGYLSHVLDW